MLSFGPVDDQPGLCFEDLPVGQEFRSPGRTVTETDIVMFAGLSGDYNVIHTDAELMKSSLFGERIAHGLLVLSIQQGLVERAIGDRARERCVGIKWKFRSPVKIGDTVHVRARVTAADDSDEPGWGLLTLEREVVNQHGEVVQSGETQHLVGRRGK